MQIQKTITFSESHLYKKKNRTCEGKQFQCGSNMLILVKKKQAFSFNNVTRVDMTHMHGIVFGVSMFLGVLRCVAFPLKIRRPPWPRRGSTRDHHTRATMAVALSLQLSKALRPKPVCLQQHHPCSSGKPPWPNEVAANSASSTLQLSRAALAELCCLQTSSAST